MACRHHQSTGVRPLAKGEAPPPVSLTHLSLLNDLSHQPLLLTGAADGAVRVWRGFRGATSTRLATAWQAVPVAHGTAPQPAAPSVFCSDVARGVLFAAGGSQAGVVQCWSLDRELRTVEVCLVVGMWSACCAGAVRPGCVPAEHDSQT